MNSFEFVAVAALRTHQLRRGCIPRVLGLHKLTTIAQMEIVQGKVARISTPEAAAAADLSALAPDPDPE